MSLRPSSHEPPSERSDSPLRGQPDETAPASKLELIRRTRRRSRPARPGIARRALARFPSAREALSATEFALVLPILLVMLLGGYEYGQVLAVTRKVTITTRALADLTTHYASVTADQVDTIMAAASQIFAPYSTSAMTIRISEVYVSAAGIATVQWSRATNTTPLASGTVLTLPVGIAQPNTYLVWSQVGYTYTPSFSFVMKNAISLSDQLFMSPRRSASVDLSS